MYTMRDVNDDALFPWVKRVLARLQDKMEANSNSGSPQTAKGDQQEAPRCTVHNVDMKRYSKNGQAWYSHQTADGNWCRGR